MLCRAVWVLEWCSYQSDAGVSLAGLQDGGLWQTSWYDLESGHSHGISIRELYLAVAMAFVVARVVLWVVVQEGFQLTCR